MDLQIDELCLRLARHADVVPVIDKVALSEDVTSFLKRQGCDGEVRTVQLGRIEAVVLAADASSHDRQGGPRTPGDSARELARMVSYVTHYGLPRRPWGRIAVIQLQDGWTDAQTVASCLERDAAAVMKFAVAPGQEPESVFDRIPASARLWDDRIEPFAASWMTWIQAPEAFGPFAEVSMALHPGPGLTVISGANGTGKSFLLGCVAEALAGAPGPVDLGFSGQTPLPEAASRICLGRARFRGEPDEAAEMRAFRRMMGYGDDQGSLFLPIALESNSAQILERLGHSLLACSRIPADCSTWPGMALDCPLAGLDEIRSAKLAETIVRLACHRQILVTTRSSEEAKFYKAISDDWGVPCASVGLDGGCAISGGVDKARGQVNAQREEAAGAQRMMA